MSKYYVYIAKCSDKSLYTGYTNDLKYRENRHNLGLGAAYTRTRRPIKIVYFEEFASKLEAMRREREIKGWSREEKGNLIKRE